jgi:8-oxo-dGTP pyrophosphatase MutT (NUDIX family)
MTASGAGTDLPWVERNVVRVVLIDSSDRVLLLHVRDLANPSFGTAWELPGGGMEPGESQAAAAARELREETGIEIAAARIGPVTWCRDVSYTYRGARRLQHEVIIAARLPGAAPPVDDSQRVDFESEDLFECRWWTVDEILTSAERFYPRSLPALLPRFLAGESIEEPAEVWP